MFFQTFLLQIFIFAYAPFFYYLHNIHIEGKNPYNVTTNWIFQSTQYIYNMCVCVVYRLIGKMFVVEYYIPTQPPSIINTFDAKANFHNFHNIKCIRSHCAGVLSCHKMMKEEKKILKYVYIFIALF